MKISYPRSTTPPPGFGAVPQARDAAKPDESTAADEAGSAAAPAATGGTTAQGALEILGTRFGPAVASSVVRALGHDPASPQVLGPKELTAAESAAETSRTAISGLNFLSSTLLSAERNGKQFRACAEAVQIDPDALPVETRRRIDAAFAREMDAADGAGSRCVDLAAAQPLMQRAIRSVLSRPG
jgi:hypothetical protein